MNILFFIGNGFDRGLGMETQYKNFLSEYVTSPSEHEYIVSFKQLIAKDSESEYNNWADCEKRLGEVSVYFTADEDGREYAACINDFTRAFAKYLDNVQEHYITQHRKDISGFAKKYIFDKVYRFWNGIDTDDNKIKGMQDGKFSVVPELLYYTFFSFNSTTVFDKYLDLSIRKTHRRRYLTQITKYLLPLTLITGGIIIPAVGWALGEWSFCDVLWIPFIVTILGVILAVLMVAFADKIELYELRQGIVYHVHGSKESFIIGVDSAAQITDSRLRRKIPVLSAIVKQRKILLNPELDAIPVQNILKSSDIICVLGMSFGETDETCWKRIRDWLLHDQSKTLIINWFEPDITRQCDLTSLIVAKTTKKAKELFFSRSKTTKAQQNIIDGQIFVKALINE